MLSPTRRQKNAGGARRNTRYTAMASEVTTSIADAPVTTLQLRRRAVPREVGDAMTLPIRARQQPFASAPPAGPRGGRFNAFRAHAWVAVHPAL